MSRLFLPIEIRSRELQHKMLLASRAASCGFSTIIGEITEVLDLVEDQGRQGDVLLHNGGLPTGFVRRIKSRGVLVVILDEEASPSGVAKDHIHLRISPEVAELLDLYLATSGEYEHLMLEAHPVLTGRTANVGFPRLDLLNPELIKLNSSPHGQKTEVKVCSSFGVTSFWGLVTVVAVLANAMCTNALELRRGTKKWASGQVSPTRFFAVKMRSALKAYLVSKRFAALLRAVSRAYPDTNFVIRPHPSESERIWVRASRKRPNMVCRWSTSIEEELRDTPLVFHMQSTIASQAALLGVTAVDLWPVVNSSNGYRGGRAWTGEVRRCFDSAMNEHVLRAENSRSVDSKNQNEPPFPDSVCEQVVRHLCRVHLEMVRDEYDRFDVKYGGCGPSRTLRVKRTLVRSIFRGLNVGQKPLRERLIDLEDAQRALEKVQNSGPLSIQSVSKSCFEISGELHHN